MATLCSRRGLVLAVENPPAVTRAATLDDALVTLAIMAETKKGIPLERAHGLASLILHTAGTHEATLVIPGLDADEAARLRDRLVAAGGDDAV